MLTYHRWATHGEPSDKNSHPHKSDPEAQFVVVHNGIITNYDTLKTMLEKKGHIFESETDTEVIVKLALQIYNQDKSASFKQVMQGVWALLVKTTFGTWLIGFRKVPLLSSLSLLTTLENVSLSREVLL